MSKKIGISVPKGCFPVWAAFKAICKSEGKSATGELFRFMKAEVEKHRELPDFLK